MSGQRWPWATLGAIGLCLGVAFFEVLSPGLKSLLAFDPAGPTLLGVVGCLFAHEGLIHLLANMVFLAAVGPAIEFSRGASRFLGVFLAGGLAGVVSHWGLNMATGDLGPLVGASGAVAGLVGFAAVRYLGTRVPLAPRLVVSVGVVALVWAVAQGVGAFVRVGSFGEWGGGSAYWAHVAGFLAGVLASLVLGGAREADQAFGHEVLDRMNLRGAAARLAAAEEHLKKHPGDVRALREKVGAFREMEEERGLRGALMELLAAVGVLEKGAVVRELAAAGGLGDLGRLDRLRLADRLAPSDGEAAVVLARSVAEEGEDAQTPDALLSLATLARGLDEELSRSAGLRLAREFPMHPATAIARQRGLVE